LQLRILSFGLLQDGDVGISVFPKGEEIFVGGERSDPAASASAHGDVLDCKVLARALPRGADCAMKGLLQFSRASILPQRW
jgi:hypothetical protein